METPRNMLRAVMKPRLEQILIEVKDEFGHPYQVEGTGLASLPGCGVQPWHTDLIKPSSCQELDRYPFCIIYACEGDTFVDVCTVVGEIVRVWLGPGDTLFFRGDVIHRYVVAIVLVCVHNLF